YSLKGNPANATGAGTVMALRCPACRQNGTFESRVTGVNDLSLTGPSPLLLGQRSCPNPTCQAHIFFVYDVWKSEVAVSYPAERIDFDTTKIPSPFVAAF